MINELQIVRLKGKDIQPFISDLAQLRIRVFREYPYLYDGHVSYEEEYLNTYSSCEESVLVLVFLKDRIIGASTAIPLEFEVMAFKKPFIDHQLNIKNVFYLGESVLLPEYRGQKIYTHFFHEREMAAREYGTKLTAFCAVKRDKDDIRRPKNYQDLHPVWEHFGYKKHAELCAYFNWKEIDTNEASDKPMEFWLKNL
jgi:GNAT superfamily N-acetyltransferase